MYISMCISIYVSLSLPPALPMLRSSDIHTPLPQTKSLEDIEELAASYERKLIEVSHHDSLLLCIQDSLLLCN